MEEKRCWVWVLCLFHLPSCEGLVALVKYRLSKMIRNTSQIEGRKEEEGRGMEGSVGERDEMKAGLNLNH